MHPCAGHIFPRWALQHPRQPTCSAALPPPDPASWPNILKLKLAAAPALAPALLPAASRPPAAAEACRPAVVGPEVCLRLLGPLLLAARPRSLLCSTSPAAAAGAGSEADLDSSSTVCCESSSTTSICSSCMMSPSCSTDTSTRYKTDQRHNVCLVISTLLLDAELGCCKSSKCLKICTVDLAPASAS